MIGGNSVRPVSDKMINGIHVWAPAVRRVTNKRGNKGIKVIEFKNGVTIEAPYQAKHRKAKANANIGPRNTFFIENAVGLKIKASNCNKRMGTNISVGVSSIKKIENQSMGDVAINRCCGSMGVGKVVARDVFVYNSRNLHVDAPEGVGGWFWNRLSDPNTNVTLGKNIKQYKH